jgi:hypothetical protein
MNVNLSSITNSGIIEDFFPPFPSLSMHRICAHFYRNVDILFNKVFTLLIAIKFLEKSLRFQYNPQQNPLNSTAMAIPLPSKLPNVALL